MSTNDPKISHAERARRQTAVSYARASIALEGFTLTIDQEKYALAFIEGLLSLKEFVSMPEGKCDSQLSVVTGHLG